MESKATCVEMVEAGPRMGAEDKVRGLLHDSLSRIWAVRGGSHQW